MLVEQNVNFALEICDYAYVLENGRCTMAGPGHEAPRRSAAARSLSAEGLRAIGAARLAIDQIAQAQVACVAIKAAGRNDPPP